MTTYARTLSPARRALLELIVSTPYGYLENLTIVGGEPIVGPPLRVFRDIKLGLRSRSPSTATLERYLEREQFAELFDLLDTIANGMIKQIEIQSSLPFRISLERTVR